MCPGVVLVVAGISVPVGGVAIRVVLAAGSLTLVPRQQGRGRRHSPWRILCWGIDERKRRESKRRERKGRRRRKRSGKRGNWLVCA